MDTDEWKRRIHKFKILADDDSRRVSGVSEQQLVPVRIELKRECGKERGGELHFDILIKLTEQLTR